MLRRVRIFEEEGLDPEVKGRRFGIQKSDIKIEDLYVWVEKYNDLIAEIKKLQDDIAVRRYLDTVEQFRDVEEKLRSFGYGEVLNEFMKEHEKTVEGLMEANEKLNRIELKLENRAKSIQVVIDKIRFGYRKQLSDKQVERLKERLREYLSLTEEQYRKVEQIIQEIMAENAYVSAAMEIIINILKKARTATERVEISLPQRKIRESIDVVAIRKYLLEGRPSWLDKVVDSALKVLGQKAVGFIKTILFFFEELFDGIRKLASRLSDYLRGLDDVADTIDEYDRDLGKIEKEIVGNFE